jgi:hypothetical protein
VKNIYQTRSLYSEIKILYLSIFEFIGVLLISILIGFFTGIITAFVVDFIILDIEIRL